MSQRALRREEAPGSIHALPLALFALGAGWLLTSLSRERQHGQRRYPRMAAALPSQGPWHAVNEKVAAYAERAGDALGKVSEVVVDRALQVDAHVANRIEDLEKGVVDRATQLRGRVAELGHHAYDSLEHSGHRAKQALGRATGRALELGGRRPVQLAVLALALGAGTLLLGGNGGRNRRRRSSALQHGSAQARS